MGAAFFVHNAYLGSVGVCAISVRKELLIELHLLLLGLVVLPLRHPQGLDDLTVVGICEVYVILSRVAHAR